jgi:S-formylglutathione hydrolase FrmB
VVSSSTSQYVEQLPDVIFMCIKDDKFKELCSLFPQTAENIKQKALERRLRYMKRKNTVSTRFRKKQYEIY